jgi:glycogen synthase
MEKTVLHVFDHSFPINDGYAFRSGEIIRFLRRLGWRTAHITSAKQGPSASPTETVSGLDFYRTQPSGRFGKIPVLGQYSIVSTLRKRLAQIHRHDPPSLLHVYSPCLNGLAALSLARRLHIPLIYEVRALWEDGAVDSGAAREGDARYRLSRMLETHVCRRADRIVTICEGLRTELIGRGLDPARIAVVPNSVDVERFTGGSPATTGALGLDVTPGKTFGFIGSFFPFEGLEVLLRAVPLILAQEPKARFVIVGDGPDGNRIRELVATLNLGGSVILTGRVPHADVMRYYDLLDVMIYPRVSKRITELVTPLKPLEAMARRKLVVASDVGGHREMVFPGQNGVLFKAGDPLSLAEACLRLLKRPEDWDLLRDNAKTYIREHRSWERNINLYDQLYRQLLAGHASGRG